MHYPTSFLACGEDRPSNHLWWKITTTQTKKPITRSSTATSETTAWIGRREANHKEWRKHVRHTIYCHR